MRTNVFMGQYAPVEAWEPGQSLSPEDRARIQSGYRRQIWTENDEYRYRKAADEKYRECIQIEAVLNDAKRAYDEAEGHDEALFEEYSTAVNRYNFCLDEYNFLWDVAQYGPPPSVPMAWQKFEYNPPEGEEPIPLEPNEPEEPEYEPPPVASVDWPPEIPKPTTEPIPLSEPEFVEPQDCDPLKGQFYDPRTGQCRGSVQTGFTSPFSFTGPSTTIPLATQAGATAASSAYLGRARLVRHPWQF